AVLLVRLTLLLAGWPAPAGGLRRLPLLLRTLLFAFSRLSAGLALLLTLLALVSVTAELIVLTLHLLHLALKLFGFAAKHFLLVPLLRSHLAALLLLGEFLLATCKLLQLFERVVHVLLALVGRILHLAGAFVLVLLGVEFEIEEALEVAGGATASA